MEFIKPKQKLGSKVSWQVSDRTKSIVKYYAEYTGLGGAEYNIFLINILKLQLQEMDTREASQNQNHEAAVPRRRSRGESDLRKLKRIAEKSGIEIEEPISSGELKSRQADYPALAPNQFAKKYRSQLQPIKLNLDGKVFEIQLNSCANPYCKWFGMPQERFESVKHKP